MLDCVTCVLLRMCSWWCIILDRSIWFSGTFVGMTEAERPLNLLQSTEHDQSASFVEPMGNLNPHLASNQRQHQALMDAIQASGTELKNAPQGSAKTYAELMVQLVTEEPRVRAVITVRIGTTTVGLRLWWLKGSWSCPASLRRVVKNVVRRLHVVTT